jgi:hypothetical protein
MSKDPVMDGRVVMAGAEARAVFLIARQWPNAPITVVRDGPAGVLVVQAGSTNGYRVGKAKDRPGCFEIKTAAFQRPKWAPKFIAPLVRR